MTNTRQEGNLHQQESNNTASQLQSDGGSESVDTPADFSVARQPDVTEVIQSIELPSSKVEYAFRALIRNPAVSPLLTFGQRAEQSPMPGALAAEKEVPWAWLWDAAFECWTRNETLNDRRLLQLVGEELCEEIQAYRGVDLSRAEQILSAAYDGDIPDETAGRDAVVELLEHFLADLPEAHAWRDWQQRGDPPWHIRQECEEQRRELQRLRDGSQQRLQGYGVAALFETAQSPRWIVHQILVAGSTAYLGGPFKSIKSGLALDLATSLAMPATVGRSRCFLNRFQCEPSNHVLAFSGEADKWEVRQRIEAIFESKSLELRSGNRRRQPTSDQSVNSLNLTLYFNAPRMALAEDKRIVRDEIRRHGADVVIFDPLYLCALSGTNVNAGSVFEMGEILQAMEDVVKDEHATPVFLHHFVKSVKPGIEPTLGHMAFAGAAERAAQWMLLNHRVPFDATNGHARLIMDVGGRAGQGGVYGVDIVEGRLNEDFTGRGWQVEVMGLDEARTRDRDQGFSRRSGQQSSGGLIGLRQRMLQHLSDRDEAVCLSPLGRELHANHSNCRDIVQQLRSERLVEVVPAYNGRDGFRLTDAGREAASSTAVSDNGLSVMDGDGD